MDLSDNDEDIEEAMDNTGMAKTAEEKAQQQFRLVESFGSEKQKRLLANARQSRVDVKDLNSSISNSLPVVIDNGCKMMSKKCVPQITFTLFLFNPFLMRYGLVGHLLSPNYCVSQFSVK